MREDLGLQRLVLETCRGHLRSLRSGAAAASPGGLTVDVGGGPSAKGTAVGAHSGGPQDEADAVRAGKAAVKKCTALAPLLLKEVFRQVCLCVGVGVGVVRKECCGCWRVRCGAPVWRRRRRRRRWPCRSIPVFVFFSVRISFASLLAARNETNGLPPRNVRSLARACGCTSVCLPTHTKLAEGNTSAAAKEAKIAAKSSKGKGGAGGDKGAKKKTVAPSESLSELALSCFEECVCITAHCSLATSTAASRTAKMFAVSHRGAIRGDHDVFPSLTNSDLRVDSLPERVVEKPAFFCSIGFQSFHESPSLRRPESAGRNLLGSTSE